MTWPASLAVAVPTASYRAWLLRAGETISAPVVAVVAAKSEPRLPPVAAFLAPRGSLVTVSPEDLLRLPGDPVLIAVLPEGETPTADQLEAAEQRAALTRRQRVTRWYTERDALREGLEESADPQPRVREAPAQPAEDTPG
jgi:hypothetical protein